MNVNTVKTFVSGALAVSVSVKAITVDWRRFMARLYVHKNEWGLSVLIWNGAVSVTFGALSLYVGSTMADEFVGLGVSVYPFDDDVTGSVYCSSAKWYDFPNQRKD